MTKQEKSEIIEKLDIILDQDSYIQNSEIVYLEELEQFEYKTWNLLIQLISSVSLDKELEKYLIENIFSENNNSYRLLFYVSCNYDLLDLFVNFFISNSIRNYDNFYLFIKLFYEKYDYFIKFFNTKQLSLFLKELKDVNRLANNYNHNNVYGYSKVLIKKIVDYRFDELSKNLIWINIEINKDKEELKRIINYFWFDTKYNEFLTNLDKHFYSENKDNIEIAWLIATFRQFNNDIIIDIALEVVKIEWLEEIPKMEWKKSTAKIWIAWDYLKEKFWLTSNEEKFLEYFTKILHEEWWHAFLSSIEYFRLTKNITIEIILLLLYKLKEFKNNQK